MTATVRRRLVVSGRVQGVFYRDSARRQAGRLGVAGWARNRSDGTVELVVEGEAAAVEEMTAWAAVGPPQAEVSDVSSTPETPESLRGFDVR